MDLTQLIFMRLTELIQTETTDLNKFQLPQEVRSNKDGNHQETPTTGPRMLKLDSKDGPTRSTHGLKSSTSDLETICKSLSQPTLPCIKTNSTENNWISLVESENLILFKI